MLSKVGLYLFCSYSKIVCNMFVFNKFLCNKIDQENIFHIMIFFFFFLNVNVHLALQEIFTKYFCIRSLHKMQ